VIVTDLGVGPMEVIAFMADHVRNIMRSGAEVTPGAANRDGAAEGGKTIWLPVDVELL
jgi:hypothetical protein